MHLMVASVAAAPLAGLAEPAEPESLSLPALLAEARTANPEIRAARARWDAAQQRVPLATGLPPPKIGLEFEEIPRGTVKVNKAITMWSFLQSFPFPGKLSLRQRVAVAEAQMAAAAFKQAEWDVVTQVKGVYYDLLLVTQQGRWTDDQLRWVGQMEGAARARYATGAAPQTEALDAQAERLTLENELVTLEHRRMALAAHLNHLLDRAGHGLQGIPGPISLSPVPSDPEALLALAEDHQPALLAARFIAERAEAAWRLSKRELWPDLEMMLQLRDPTAGPVGPWDLMLAMALPFWFWTKQQYGVKAALFDKASAEAAAQAMRRMAEREVHEHWHEASAAHASAVLCRDRLIPLARQAVASTMAAYEGGRGSFADAVAALKRLTQRQTEYDQALVAMEQHLAMLEQTVGVPLREV